MFVASVETGTAAGVLVITLSDGSHFFVLAEFWNKTGLTEGAACSSQTMLRIWAESETVRVTRKAVELLSRREYSRYELKLRLEQRGFDPEVIVMVLDDLVARGLQDDARFALCWISARLRRRPEGRSNLLFGLRERGVASDVAGEALADIDRDQPGWERDALARAYERATRRTGIPESKIIQRLRRLGFGFSEVERFITGQNESE